MRSIRLCALLLFFTTTDAAQCAAPPLELPLRSLSVAPGTISRGIPISIGTPPQQIVLSPSLQLDTPFIPRYTKSCIYGANTPIPANDTRWEGQDEKAVCAGIYGGGFVPSLSKTFYDNGTNSPVSEIWFKRARFSEWHFVTDEFVFADYLEAYVQQTEVLPKKRYANTSFVLADEGATFGGLSSSALSLTPASRMLETLYQGGMVASKSWSLSNESLCLGCIDGNAYTGEFRDVRPATRERGGLSCLLQVKVESLDYHADATNAGVALIDTAYVTCVEPGVPFLVLPTDVRTKLPGKVTAGIETALGHNSFLRFRIEGGLEVDVVMEEIGGSDTKIIGEQIISLQTGSWGAYGEGIPVLGRPFTKSIVLRWDETSQQYGLAKKTPKADEKTELKPLGCDDFPSISKSVETTPSIGVIVGSIIGGFVAGLIFTMAAVFFYWRGHRGVKSKYEAMRGDDAVSLRAVDLGGRTLESRMSNASSVPAPSFRESLRSHFSQRSVSPQRAVSHQR
ncbi:hypothetical protein C7974DRAFT_409464 [Boeremia exigua]|uniref:uncharacterized protein n=1 Tax=Boeremia exigua TaxID=749465 RepID=UPI001E8D93FB|nr:uncharacterized protein C7974DRAFT_409464 [Boeremia exigua]KAH6642958.1 hypothetical protein C7974DRAFT_409464 [Boeremia exigua]